MTLKAVFVDRDGTINEERNYVYRVDDFRFLPGAVEGLKMLKTAGLKVYIITNQSGIARGYYTVADYEELTNHLKAELNKEGIVLDGYFYCPHHIEGKVPEYSVKCSCRKPGTAMMDGVIAQEHYQPEEMALIGDNNSDIEAGLKLGMDTWLVETGHGLKAKADTRAHHVVADLKTAARAITKGL